MIPNSHFIHVFFILERMNSPYSYLELERTDRLLKYQLLINQVPATYERVLHAWAEEPEFGRFFTQILRDCPFEALFWECVPVDDKSKNRIFEFVLLDSPALARIDANSIAFDAKFSESSHHQIAVFPNLGRNAILVAPKPIEASIDHYAHLVHFLRKAGEEQIQNLWREVGLAMQSVINENPTWLSTSGLGVYWLHIRLDTRPKYYQHQAYRRF